MERQVIDNNLEERIKKADIKREFYIKNIFLKDISRTTGFSISYISHVMSGRRFNKKIWSEITKISGIK